ncbi:trypsin-1-like [Neocloeon triangulifer]|uniref:trypsin-1-like n=1 Tax=Neocloeon triangulifer TaxID=2078957 RepID=UPI00286F656E|nr:trypsin-1-like [Neocloeon triangulifer]XP_059485324.1 trypsin-1-like [Neocloeon triangulifer]XP_059485325.1 trypsin-1-like [Neocloeon triangulifer]
MFTKLILFVKWPLFTFIVFQTTSLFGVQANELILVDNSVITVTNHTTFAVYVPYTLIYFTYWGGGIKQELKSEPQAQSRILGGTAAVAEQFTFYIYVEATKYNGIVKCGGALLSEDWAITSATCVAAAATIQVYAGIIAPPTATDTMVYARAIIHPQFRFNYKVHNLALLKFRASIPLGISIAPIRILAYDLSKVRTDLTLRTMGLGTSDDSTDVGTELQYVDLPRIRRQFCNIQTSNSFIDYPLNTECLGTEGGSKGFCFVDIGGPVVYVTPGTQPNVEDFKLVGINSEFVGCPSNQPMAFTRLAPYVSWIRVQTKNTFFS